MKKKTFLGFDITPRKVLWQEIEEQKESYNDLLEHLKDATARSSNTYKELSIAKLEIDKKESEIAQLRERLSRYARCKDKNGRFTKRK
ncbi:MAG: hypothetical protein NC209_04045 [Alistipes sp.]|nr:hypothetical protein [Lachnospiraceae bacterium]MCM1250303.1 hypothetical protein [Alistipes sp.]